MKKILLLCLLNFFFLSIILANTRFYRATYRDDPSTSIVIGWSDDSISTNAKVYFGTQDFGIHWNLYPMLHSVDTTVTHMGLVNRFARISGLVPNTVYYFVIRDDQGVSQRMWFKTLSNDPNVPLCFISGGDSREGYSGEFEYQLCHQRRLNANIMVSKLNAAFVAFQGDFIYYSTDSLWSRWLNDWQLTISSSGRITPIVPVTGNHESALDVYNLFGIPSLSSNYALTFGGNLFRLYSLNSNLGCDSLLLSAFEADLQQHSVGSEKTYWKMAQYHHALMPHAHYSEQTTLIQCYTPLFKNYEVALAMEAHNHVQKITYPVIVSTDSGSFMGFERNDTLGTTYIGEGGWGAPMRDLYQYYDTDHAYEWTLVQGKFQAFNFVSVSKQEVQIRTILSDSVLYAANDVDTSSCCSFPSGLAFWQTPYGSAVSLPVNNPVTVANTQESLLQVKIFPNPVNHFLFVSAAESKYPKEVELYNILGKKLFSSYMPMEEYKISIDFKPYAYGIYLLKIKQNNFTNIYKIIYQ